MMVISILAFVMLVAVVVMCMATAHGGQGHGEGLHVFGLKLQHVGALFEVVD